MGVSALKRLRLERGLTQRQLAELSGWPDRLATISDLELGKSNPTLSTLQAIANALQVPVRDLFEPDEKEASINQMMEGLAALDPEDRELLYRLARRLVDR